MRRTQYPINLWESPIDAVENIVAGLNEAEPIYREGQRFLRELVMKWNNYGRNLNTMFKEEPALAAIISREWKVFLAPTNDGGACMCISPSAHQPRVHLALYLFMNFLIHRGWRRLGGPCSRCHRYYVKKTVRQTVYCSRKCAKDATAAAASSRRLENQKAADLRSARAAIERWERGSRRQHWKRFVAGQCRLSLHFLTRAVNAGRLRVPNERKAKRHNRPR